MYHKDFTRSNNGLTGRKFGGEGLLRAVALLALVVTLLTPLSLGSGNTRTAKAAALPQLVTSQQIHAQSGSATKNPRATNPTAYAWGYNDHGQLGNGAFGFVDPDLVTVTLPSGVANFTALSAGGEHSVGQGSDGKLYAWGYNGSKQLGNSSLAESNVPVAVSLPDGVTGFTSFEAGTNGNMAKGSDGKLYTWGSDSSGELGDNSLNDSPIPVLVTLPSGVTSFTAYSAGGSHNLGMGSNGKLYAWGNNTFGELGNSTVPTQGVEAFSAVPVTVDLPTGVTGFTTFSAGEDDNFALGSDGKLYAWGNNVNGQLGTNSNDVTNVALTPVVLPAGVTSFTSFKAGGFHSMGIGNDGKLYAWGYNNFGELGNNSHTTSLVPVLVNLPSGVTNYTAYGVGGNYSIAMGNDGKLYSWGANANGQLGNTSTTTNNPVPTAVNLPAGAVVNGFAVSHIGTHNLVNLSIATPPPPTGYSYYLPLVANAANTSVGQTTTFVTFQNLSTTASANVSVQYYGLTSGTPGQTDSFTLPTKGQKAILPNIGSGNSGGGIITSDQPLNVVVSEAISTGGSAYNVTSQTAATLYSPLALNGAFGGFTTNIVVFNTGNTAAAGQIQFYAADGTVAATHSFSIAGHASQSLSQAGLTGLSNSQSYWAKISGAANSVLTAQVIEFGPNNFVATFNASVPTQAATKLYAPAVFNGLYGYVTGMAFANPNGTAANVSVTYYNGNGSQLGTQTVPITANGNGSLFQGADGTSPNIASAVISSDQPIVMTVNERGPNAVSGTYAGIVSGSTSVALPVMANGFAGFITGTTIFNAGGGTATLTLTYLDANGQPVGTPQSTTTLAPNASFALYQGASNQGLASGYFGTALITSNQPLLVTTNALNTTTGLFYTYTAPNS